MKRLRVIFLIIAIVSLAGCASGGGKTAASVDGGAAGSGAAPFVVDLSKLGGKVDLSKLSADETSINTFTDSKQVMKNGKVTGIINVTPFTKAWENLLIQLPASALPSDFSKYTRFTLTVKYYDAASMEIEQGDSNCLASMIYDLKSDIRGASSGPGPNTPIKEFNVGGYSGMIHKDRGVRVTFKEAPQAVLLQNNSGSKVAFIELSSMVFHNGNYETE